MTNGEYRLTGTSTCQTGSSCTGTADEVVSAIAYDVSGNVTSTSSGNGAGTRTAASAMTYDALGNLLTVDGPLSGAADTMRMRYDNGRRVVGSVSPDPDGGGALKHRAVRSGDGPPDDPMPGDDPEPTTTRQCTNYSRIASVTNSYGFEIRFAYASPAGSGPTAPPSTFDQRTGASFHNNEAGGGAQASVTYEAQAGGVTKVTDMAGRAWYVTTDHPFTPTYYGIRRPGAASDTTRANLAGGVVTSVLKEGVTTHYSRPPSGGAVEVTLANPGGTSPTSRIEWSPASGRPTSVTDPLNHRTGFEYDSSDRLKKVIAPEGNYVEHS
ncbi:MAG TPA: RHS repeat domain-containing protein [Allosphingosinicella sp.]|nr:RHS repeat domain-containing protein [Allosphingosinicella sp.]